MTKQGGQSEDKTLFQKESACKFFSETVLKNLKEGVGAIYLFGSLAYGSPQKDSDIDILIFSKNPKRAFPLVWNATLETYEKFGESVEPLIYPSEKYQKPNSYFLYQIIHEGKRLYP
jgi:predicted nucleotidyltransferase